MSTENSQNQEIKEETVAPSIAPEASAPETTSVEAAPAVIIEETKHSPLQIVGAIVAGLLILGGAGYFAYTNYYVQGGVAAVVNGKKIYEQEVQEMVTNVVGQNAQMYGIDTTTADADAKIREQALDLLVTSAILITAAEQKEFTVTEEDVDGAYQEIVAMVGGEETLRSQMASVGLTDEKLRKNLRERKLIDQYLEAETDIEDVTVSEEEVQDFMTSLEGENIEIPPLEEIRPQIEGQLKAQKQQVIMDDLIEKLRGEAEIEIR